MKKAMILDVQHGSYVDGPGMRTTVFFKGCNLRCKWCHNPEGLAREKQLLFFKNSCTDCRMCQKVCPSNLNSCSLCGECAFYCVHGARKISGKEYTLTELKEQILKDVEFYRVSGGGVTFSGGECMLQIDFLKEILKTCKDVGIHTAVDTAGNVPYEYFQDILPFTDLFLYDVKCVSEQLHTEGTGVSNVRIIENLKKLCKEAKVTVRIPLIKGFNDDLDEIKKMKDLLSKMKAEVEVCKYHDMGKIKYQALGLQFNEYPLFEDEEFDNLKNMLMKK